MPIVTEIFLLDRPETHTLGIRTRTRVEDLPTLIGPSYGKIAAYLDELGTHMADIPFVAYHNMDMQNLDLEIGFPVAKALPGKEDIQAATIPGGLAVGCVYQGPYTGLREPYDELGQWIQANGYTPTGVAYEFYFNGPPTPEDKLLTLILFPVHK